MLTQVPLPMFVDYFSLFISGYDSVIVDNSCLWTVGNDGSLCSLSKNTTRSETGDVSVTESSDGTKLYYGSSGDKGVSWSDFVVRVHNDGWIEYENMSSVGGTAEGWVGISESKIPVQLENGTAW